MKKKDKHQKEISEDNSSDLSESEKAEEKNPLKKRKQREQSSSEEPSDSSESEEEKNKKPIDKKKKTVQEFSDIKITPEILANVDSFKAITARGKKRSELNKKEHKDLVKEKYQKGQEKKGHITLFRVEDKKGLAKKERDEHTVPGPNWTPPSSVGFVLGGLSKRNRVWLATKPEIDKLLIGGKSNDVNPSIYARETSTALHYGWTPREPKTTEQYGKTGRGPIVVLTPPSSPRAVQEEIIANIMNVKSGWSGLGAEMDSADQLSSKLTPVSKQSIPAALSTSNISTTDTSPINSLSNMPSSELKKAKDAGQIVKNNISRPNAQSRTVNYTKRGSKDQKGPQV